MAPTSNEPDSKLEVFLRAHLIIAELLASVPRKGPSSDPGPAASVVEMPSRRSA